MKVNFTWEKVTCLEKKEPKFKYKLFSSSQKEKEINVKV